MCGRYHIDQKTLMWTEEYLGEYPWYRGLKDAFRQVKEADVFPSDAALVLGESQIPGEMEFCRKKWGFKMDGQSRLLINVRAETALLKPGFSGHVKERRCVIPAAWFYEWKSRPAGGGGKERITFLRQKEEPVLMAGFYRQEEDGDHFVILTTRANSTMEPVHDRMPLILEPEEVGPWLFSLEEAKELLRKVPAGLKREAEYEQQTLFDYINEEQ